PAPPSRAHHGKAVPPPSVPHDSFDLMPLTLDLGGNDSATLTGHLDDSGYTLHLTGPALASRLRAVGEAVPQLGDGLSACLPVAPESDTSSQPRRHPARPVAEETALPLDLTATRAWGGPQSWCPATALSSPPNGGKQP